MVDFRKDYDWTGVVAPVTDEQAKLLVAALRSGNYDQAKGQFHRLPDEDCKGGFCCLGVANEVWEAGKDGGHAVFHTEAGEGAPIIIERLPYPLQIDLYRMNDAGIPFNDIADHIERGFNLV